MAKRMLKKDIELEVKKRINHAKQMLINKMSKQDIRTSMIRKFNINEKQVDVYIKEAKKTIKPDKKKDNKKQKTVKQTSRVHREDIFCAKYIIEFNATKAAIEAGWSKKSARQEASRLLSNVNIQNKIKDLIDVRKNKLHINRDQVINEVRKIGFSDIGDFIESAKFTKDGIKFDENIDTSLIKKITITHSGPLIMKSIIELHSKERALELLMKHLNLLTENIKISGDKDNPIVNTFDFSGLSVDELKMLKELQNFINNKCIKDEKSE